MEEIIKGGESGIKEITGMIQHTTSNPTIQKEKTQTREDDDLKETSKRQK